VILAATAAHQKYSPYLNELHVKEANDGKSKKSKALQEELEQLKTKKRRLQNNAVALEKVADDLLTKQNRNMSLCALRSLTVCGILRSRSWLTFRHLTCSWKVSSSSVGTNDASAAIELM